MSGVLRLRASWSTQARNCRRPARRTSSSYNSSGYSGHACWYSCAAGSECNLQLISVSHDLSIVAKGFQERSWFGVCRQRFQERSWFGVRHGARVRVPAGTDPKSRSPPSCWSQEPTPARPGQPQHLPPARGTLARQPVLLGLHDRLQPPRLRARDHRIDAVPWPAHGRPRCRRPGPATLTVL